MALNQSGRPSAAVVAGAVIIIIIAVTAAVLLLERPAADNDDTVVVPPPEQLDDARFADPYADEDPEMQERRARWQEERRRRRAERSQITPRMTFGQVAATCGMAPDSLAQALDLPPDWSRQERLGTIQQRHGFTIADVEERCVNRLD